MSPRLRPLLALALLAAAPGALAADAAFPPADGIVLALKPLPAADGDGQAPDEDGTTAPAPPDNGTTTPSAETRREQGEDGLRKLDELLYDAGEHPGDAPGTAGEAPEGTENEQSAQDRRGESGSGTQDRNASAPSAAPDGNGELPGPAGPSAEERRGATLDRARVLLEKMDETLYGAQEQAQDRRDREQAGAPPADGGDAEHGGAEREDARGEEDGPPAEQAGDEAGGAERTAEGEVPGNVATGRSGRRHGYNDDDDLVTKQVCELAETEPDPEVRDSLKKRCRELRKE